MAQVFQLLLKHVLIELTIEELLVYCTHGNVHVRFQTTKSLALECRPHSLYLSFHCSFLLSLLFIPTKMTNAICNKLFILFFCSESREREKKMEQVGTFRNGLQKSLNFSCLSAPHCTECTYVFCTHLQKNDWTILFSCCYDCWPVEFLLQYHRSKKTTLFLYLYSYLFLAFHFPSFSSSPPLILIIA